jgi:hypothetical protein
VFPGKVLAMHWRRSSTLAIIIGLSFAVGGLVGWSQRPTEWSVGLWQTAVASVNAETYGHAYESKAERVLLFFMYGGMLGALVGAVIAGVFIRATAGRLRRAS